VTQLISSFQQAVHQHLQTPRKGLVAFATVAVPFAPTVTSTFCSPSFRVSKSGISSTTMESIVKTLSINELCELRNVYQDRASERLILFKTLNV